MKQKSIYMTSAIMALCLLAFSQQWNDQKKQVTKQSQEHSVEVTGKKTETKVSPLKIVQQPAPMKNQKEDTTTSQLEKELVELTTKLEDLNHIARLNNDSTPKSERREIRELMVKKEKIRQKLLFSRIRNLRKEAIL